MKRLFLALCLLISTQVIFAQIITSKNVIVERTVITKDYPHALKSGYRGFVEGAGALSFYDVNPALGFDVLTTHGYQCGNWFYIGVGVGFSGIQEILDRAVETHLDRSGDYQTILDYSVDTAMMYSLPIYLDMRIYMSRGKVKPFLDIKAGYAFGFNIVDKDRWETTCFRPNCPGHDSEFEVEYLETMKYSGLYTQFGFGLECKHFDISVNYSMRGNQRHIVSDTDNVSGWDAFHNRLNYAILTLNLGVNF